MQHIFNPKWIGDVVINGSDLMANAILIRQLLLGSLTLAFTAWVYLAVGHPYSGFVILLMLLKSYVAGSEDVYADSLYTRTLIRHAAKTDDTLREEFRRLNKLLAMPDDVVMPDEWEAGSNKAAGDSIVSILEKLVLVALMADYVLRISG